MGRLMTSVNVKVLLSFAKKETNSCSHERKYCRYDDGVKVGVSWVTSFMNPWSAREKIEQSLDSMCGTSLIRTIGEHQ